MRALRCLMVILSSCMLAVPGCDHGGAPRRAESEAAAAVEPLGSLTGPRVAATGRVEGWREADVTSKLPGRILRYAYGEGDQVAAGAAVVQLEDRDLRTRVRAAEARTLEAKRALERLRTLRRERIVAQSEVDRAEAEYQTCTADLDEAHVMVDYATIRAPFAGTLVRKFKEIGESVLTNGRPDPLYRIADLSRLKVTAEVPERDIAAVHVGQSAEVTAEAYPGQCLQGTVHQVGLAVGRKQLASDDPRENLHEKVIEVEVELSADERLKTGMTVDVFFPRAADSTACAR
jgi:RND family efflux transporter MFP subunit